jgi:hypothetical protein
MSLIVERTKASDAITDAIRDLRRAIVNAKADLVRTESALSGLGAGSDAAQLYPALSLAQRVFDSGVAVNIAATTLEHHLGVLAALKAAGRE